MILDLHEEGKTNTIIRDTEVPGQKEAVLLISVMSRTHSDKQVRPLKYIEELTLEPKNREL